jgi:hypothetical protein
MYTVTIYPRNIYIPKRRTGQRKGGGYIPYHFRIKSLFRQSVSQDTVLGTHEVCSPHSSRLTVLLGQQPTAW